MVSLSLPRGGPLFAIPEVLLYVITVSALIILPLMAVKAFSLRTNYFGLMGMIVTIVLIEFLIPSSPLFGFPVLVLIGLGAGIILGEATDKKTKAMIKEIQKAFRETFEQGKLEQYEQAGEFIIEPAIRLEDTLQDLQPGEEVIFDNDGTELRCRFHEYRDEGFTCVLEDLEIKRGLLFIAFTNQISFRLRK